MVPLAVLVMAPFIIGGMIYGTTQIVSHRNDDKAVVPSASIGNEFASIPFTLDKKAMSTTIFSAIPTMIFPPLPDTKVEEEDRKDKEEKVEHQKEVLRQLESEAEKQKQLELEQVKVKQLELDAVKEKESKHEKERQKELEEEKEKLKLAEEEEDKAEIALDKKKKEGHAQLEQEKQIQKSIKEEKKKESKTSSEVVAIPETASEDTTQDPIPVSGVDDKKTESSTGDKGEVTTEKQLKDKDVDTEDDEEDETEDESEDEAEDEEKDRDPKLNAGQFSAEWGGDIGDDDVNEQRSEHDASNKRSLKTRQAHHHHHRSQKRSTRQRQGKLHKRLAGGKGPARDPTGDDVIAYHEKTGPLVKSSKGGLGFHEVIQAARKAPVSDRVADAHLDNETQLKAVGNPSVPVEKGQLQNTSQQEQAGNGVSFDADHDPDFVRAKALIDRMVDEQTAMMHEELAQFVQSLAQSDEIEPYEDVLENLAISRLESQSKNEQDIDQQLRLFRASGPKSVSRISLFTAVLNELVPPAILQVRSDLRNILIWLFTPPTMAHIGVTERLGDDGGIRRAIEDDAKTLVHPDGSIDLKAIWDPRIGKLAMECLEAHWEQFSSELLRLAGRRFSQGKQFLVDELRGLIGLPKLSASDVFAPHEEQVLGEDESDNEEPAHVPEQKLQVEPLSVSIQQLELLPQIEKRVVQPSQGPRGKLYIQQNEASSGEFVNWFVESLVGNFRDYEEALAQSKNQMRYQDDQDTEGLVKDENTGDAEGTTAPTCSWMKEKVAQALGGDE